MTQWRTQTAFFNQSVPIDNSADFFQTGLFIGKDGEKLYHTDSNDLIYEYTMTTPYDISTMSFTQSKDISTQTTAPRDMWFTPDGLTMFVLANDRVFDYSLSIAWDVSTASFSGTQKSLFEDTNHNSLYFREDGLLMFTIGNGSSSEGSNDRVYKYDLTTPYDISTISFTPIGGSFHVSENFPTGIFFEDNGLRMFVLGATDTFLTTGSTMWEYPLGTAWEINTTSSPSELSLETQDTTPFGVHFQLTPTKNAGARFWHGGRENDNIYEWSMEQVGLEQGFVVNAILTREFVESEVNAILVVKQETTFDIGARLVWFCDQIESNTGWITTNGGGQILVDDPSFPDVIRLEVLTGGGGVTERWTRKDIGRTLDGDIKFEFKFDFVERSSLSSSSSTALFNLQENPTHPNNNPGDRIGFTLTRSREGSHVLIGLVSDGVTTVTASNGGSQNQHTTWVYPSANAVVTPDPSIVGPYFVTVELKDNVLRASLFKDSERTQHFRGSPLEVDATGVNPTNLRYVTFSNIKGSGTGRRLTAEIDDIYVTQNEPLPAIPSKPSPANGQFTEDWDQYPLTDQNPSPWFSNNESVAVSGSPSFTNPIDIREVSDENPDTGTRAFKQRLTLDQTTAGIVENRVSVTRNVDAVETTDGSGLDVAIVLSARQNAIALSGDSLGRSSGVMVRFSTIAGSPSGGGTIQFRLFGNGNNSLWTGSSWVNANSRRLSESNTLGTYAGFEDINLKTIFDTDSFVSNNLGLDFESHVTSMQIAYTGQSRSLGVSSNTEVFINGNDGMTLFGESIQEIRTQVNALIQAKGDVKCADAGVALEDDFSSAVGWDVNDFRIRVNTVDKPGVLGLVNLPTTSLPVGVRRGVKELDTPSSIANDNFIWEFKHIHYAGGGGIGGGDFASEAQLTLKETSNDIIPGASADETTIKYRTDVVTSTGPEGIRLEVFDKNAVNSVISSSVMTIRDNGIAGFTFYPRITKNGDTITLEMYIDEGRTTLASVGVLGGLVSGVPVVQVDTTGFDFSQELAFIWAGNYAGGGQARQAREDFDDIFLANDCLRSEVDAILELQPGVFQHEFKVNALLERSGDVLCAGDDFLHQDNIDTDIGWTNNGGSQIQIDTVTYPKIIRLENLTSTTQGLKRAVKTLDNQVESSSNFIWEFKHVHLAGGTSSSSEMKIELKETANNSLTGKNADETTIRYRTDVTPIQGPERLELEVYDNNGTNGVQSNEGEIILEDNFTFYPRITKEANTVKLEMFIDSGRTQLAFEPGGGLISGSNPVQIVDITGFDMSQPLNHIYVGNYDTGGSARQANEEFDQILIRNDCLRIQVDACLEIKSDEAVFSDVHLQDIVPVITEDLFIIQEHEFFVNAIVVIRQTQNGLTASPLISALDQEKEFFVGKLVGKTDEEEFIVNAQLTTGFDIPLVASPLIEAIGQEHEFEVGKLVGVINKEEFFVNALLKALGDNGDCTVFQGNQQFCYFVDALLEAQGVITPESEPEVDAILVLEVIATEEEFEVDAVLGLLEPQSILDVESVIGHKTGLSTS